jgi:hypothetical protein
VFNSGTAVTLTATPAAGATFTGWSGACTGTGTCAVTMNAAASVTANFGLQPFALTRDQGRQRHRDRDQRDPLPSIAARRAPRH